MLRPELDRAGDKLVVAYSDGKGPEAGVHARFLDGDGRIAGPAIPVTPPKAGSFRPSLAPAPDGSFYVAWTDEVDTDSEDLFLRHLGPALEVVGDVGPRHRPRPGRPQQGARALPLPRRRRHALLVAFRLERDPQRLIYQLSRPARRRGQGPPAPKKGEPQGPQHRRRRAGQHRQGQGRLPLARVRRRRLLRRLARRAAAAPGRRTSIRPRRSPSRASKLQQDRQPPRGRRLGLRPGAGRLVRGRQGRDRLHHPRRRGHAHPHRPHQRRAADALASRAGSKPGEWYLAWLDYEAGHLEAYAARVQCK